MSDIKAEDLDYHQRKALRRLGRGKSINRSMLNDPVIERLYSLDHITPPPNLDDLPYPLDMFAWCDWEEAVRGEGPRLNELGKKVLASLEEIRNDHYNTQEKK